MERVDCIVVGAGVIGLACARALAAEGLQTIVLEEQARIGTGISSRNSEVIHAGLYYEPGSLKAQLCVRGRRLLYAYLQQRRLPHARLGKLLVATEEAQLPALAALLRQAQANGVDGLQWLDETDAVRLEPQLHCRAAVNSPDTGILDCHALMLALCADVQDRGGSIALRSPLVHACRSGAGWQITGGGDDRWQIACDFLINAAGLGAQSVAACIDEYPRERIPPLRLARGCYFALSGRAPFRRLIYPMPGGAGLGIHLTLDMNGAARFGPDVQWIDRIDFDIDAARAQLFYPSIRAYWPQLPDGALHPSYAGIRPKLSGPGEAARDFVIDGPDGHGLPGLVQLFGFESPGLTAALAVGEHVASIAARR